MLDATVAQCERTVSEKAVGAQDDGDKEDVGGRVAGLEKAVDGEGARVDKEGFKDDVDHGGQ